MRIPSLLVASLCLAACRPASKAPEPAKPAEPVQAVRIAFEPASLCGALNGAGLIGSRWKKGASGFGCSSNELQIGARDLATAASSTVWYEVRGADENSATTIVLGGDVRLPEAESAVQGKLIDLGSSLLQKLNMQMDQSLETAIRTNTLFDQRIGNYTLRYSSEMVGKVRENRLTVQRAL